MWFILPSLGPPSLEFVTTYTHMKVDVNGGLEHSLDLENVSYHFILNKKIFFSKIKYHARKKVVAIVQECAQVEQKSQIL